MAGGRDFQLLKVSCFILWRRGCLDNGEEVFLVFGVPSRRCKVYLVAKSSQGPGSVEEVLWLKCDEVLFFFHLGQIVREFVIQDDSRFYLK